MNRSAFWMGVAAAVFSLCPAQADEQGKWDVVFNPMSGKVSAFEKAITEYVRDRLEIGQISENGPARKRTILIKYNSGSSQALSIYAIAESKFTVAELYRRTEHKLGCWRLRKFSSTDQTIYQADFVFVAYSDLTEDFKTCLDRMAVDAER